MADEKLEKIAPLSAFGFVICGIGGLWTLLTYMNLCNSVNKLKADANLQFFWMLVPILYALKLSDTIKAVNALIDEKGAKTDKVADNIVINFLIPLLPIYQMYNAWNTIVDAVEGTGGGEEA